ncbi:hypothetical protein CGMCC3_g4977 [Colletotrichum fructicola]|nr:uncharacterized protein CGMCC3_g4977 [Colletotrichum fructicola]KAE9578715.1 hypothetical protein CGMCC3_g4977 [Colletotrichum fructicola]
MLPPNHTAEPTLSKTNPPEPRELNPTSQPGALAIEKIIVCDSGLDEDAKIRIVVTTNCARSHYCSAEFPHHIARLSVNCDHEPDLKTMNDKLYNTSKRSLKLPSYIDALKHRRIDAQKRVGFPTGKFRPRS